MEERAYRFFLRNNLAPSAKINGKREIFILDNV